MILQPTYNEFGSPEKFYRFQTYNSGTTYESSSGFIAGNFHGADHFPNLDYDKQQSIVQNHSNWSIAKASPFISTTSDLAWAIIVAKKIRSKYPIYIAEISPGRAVSGSIRYYHWFKLVDVLNAKIEHKAKNYHETVFLKEIPQEAITWYGTVEEAEKHNFEDEEDEDPEQEQDEDEEEKELLSLMSQLKMDLKRDDEHEGEEETEEVEERYTSNQLAAEADDQLKTERTRADEQDGEEIEKVKNLTQLYYEMIADLTDGIGASEQYFWDDDSDCESQEDPDWIYKNIEDHWERSLGAER